MRRLPFLVAIVAVALAACSPSAMLTTAIFKRDSLRAPLGTLPRDLYGGKADKLSRRM